MGAASRAGGGAAPEEEEPVAPAKDAHEQNVRRVASVLGLVPERTDEYLRHHQAVWPEVLAALRAANVTNYSIYRHGDLLFSYFEYRGTDYEADMARIADDPATQAWWALMMPMQRSLRSSPNEPWWTDIDEVFHLD